MNVAVENLSRTANRYEFFRSIPILGAAHTNSYNIVVPVIARIIWNTCQEESLASELSITLI